MVRALWTGASGMTAQQTSLDNIANNLANVNTTGYKKQTTEFSSLLYQKLQTKTVDNNGDPKPVVAQVGSGVRVSGLSSIYTQGAFLETGKDTDMCIDGDGFYRIQAADGSEVYTRNGAFQYAIDGDGVTLATAEGYPVLSALGERIHFGSEYDPTKIQVDQFGNFTYPDDETGVQMSLGISLGFAQFNNPAGLDKLSNSYLRETENSGEVRYEGADTSLKRSNVRTGYLEGSNVQVVDEIVNMIVTQRAYEMNSKVITAADEMMQQANNLRS